MAIRRNPFEEMERLMNEMRHSMFGDSMFGDAPFRRGGSGAHVSVEADDEGYVAVADLPGFEKEEIGLTLRDGVLAIDAEHDDEGREDAEGESEMGHSEMRHAQGTRRRRVHERVRLPEGDAVVAEEITASYTNGVLEVRLPTERAPDDDDAARIDID